MTRQVERNDHSAGGVVLDRRDGVVHVALIQPAGAVAGSWSLPKGGLEPGEDALQAALREVREETGLTCEPVAGLTALRYTYRAKGRPVTKTVELWLMRVASGEIDAIDEAMRVEIARAQWVPLLAAIDLMTHRDEAGGLSEVINRLAAQGTPISNS